MECPGCQRIMRTRTEVHDDASENDHLYLMEASDFLHGMVKIGRSHDPGERACALRPFRVDGSPGVEWYKLSLKEAYRAIGAILFDEEEVAS